MSDQNCRVVFWPSGQVAQVNAGETILSAAVAAGLPLNAPCGGHGRCGKCRVRILQGHPAPLTDLEAGIVSAADLEDGIRLACQAEVIADLEVEVTPEAEVIGRKPLEDDLLADLLLDPDVRALPVTVLPPSLEDQRSDFRRLSDALASEALKGASLGALRALPQVMRGGDYQFRTIIRDGRLLAVQAPQAARAPLGVAVDIGTTTVVAYLVDLQTGEHLGSGVAHNPQAQHGADVISRTEYTKTHPDGLARLQREAAGVVGQVISQALGSYGGRPEDVYEMTVVGNTCMHHLFLGLDPRHIAEAPYIPVVSEAYCVPATALGLHLNSECLVHCLPVIAGYVGADTVGVILATRMMESAEAILAVDIGTNGEVALWSGERLLCASCAAGPAFEGAQIEFGMRAAPGAISEVTLEAGDLQVQTIAGQPAVGICGSGLFDVMAALLKSGVVDMMGRMVPAEQAERLPPALAARLEGEGSQRRCRLADGEADRPVYFTQRDVRELQLAKGAVCAAVELLLKEASLTVSDLKDVLLAGAFGNTIRPSSAVAMGLLPAMDVEKIQGVGNAAGAGAMMTLLSRRQRELATEVARRAEHVELAQRADFQQMFMETMLFP